MACSNQSICLQPSTIKTMMARTIVPARDMSKTLRNRGEKQGVSAFREGWVQPHTPLAREDVTYRLRFRFEDSFVSRMPVLKRGRAHRAWVSTCGHPGLGRRI